MQTLIGLLTVTGMRIGEAIRLDRDDLDLEHGRVVIATASSANPVCSRCTRPRSERCTHICDDATSCAPMSIRPRC
jgi:integrase